MKLRQDIDGLRGVAVALVLLFHFRVPYFAGGYTGVDVFFVISGFLITSILWNEYQTSGRIDFKHFYFRRARRLLPALFATLLIALLLSPVFFTPFGQQQELAKSSLASLLFAANFYFGFQAGSYFDETGGIFPLLHLWSLGVEEQFYLIFPWVLFLLASAISGRRRVVAALLLLILLSLAHGWALSEAESAFAYYSPFARHWQILLGAVLGLVLYQRAVPTALKTAAPALAAVGIGLLGLGLLVAANTTDIYHVGFGLAPALGSALLILAGSASETNLFSTLLKNRVLVFAGKISYPLYLVHWPIISMAKAVTMNEISVSLGLFLAALCVGLAYLIYRYIERPIQQVRSADSRPFWRRNAAVFTTVFVMAGGLGLLASEFPHRMFDQQLVETRNTLPPLRTACLHDWTKDYDGLRDRDRCTFVPESGPNSLQVVLWGDSHADHLSPIFARKAAQEGLGTLQRTFANCPPILDYGRNVDPRLPADCPRFNNEVMSELRELVRQDIQRVVLSRYWLWELPEHAEELRARLDRTLTDLSDLVPQIDIVAATPQFPFPSIECLARRGPENCTVARADFEAEREWVHIILQELAAKFPNVNLVDFADQLCDEALCYVQRQDTIYFRDTDHFSAAGAYTLVYP